MLPRCLQLDAFKDIFWAKELSVKCQDAEEGETVETTNKKVDNRPRATDQINLLAVMFLWTCLIQFLASSERFLQATNLPLSDQL